MFGASAQSTKKRHIELYDIEASVYDAKRAFYEKGYGGIRERKMLSLYSRGPKVLYLAVGTGRHLKYLAERHHEVIGIDLSRGMLAVAKRKGSNFRNVHLLRSDAECLPFRSEVVDEVVCSRAFKFFPNPMDALKEGSRVLEKKGKLIISLETSDPLWIRVGFSLHLQHMGNPFEHRYRVKKIQPLLTGAEFRILFIVCIIYFGKPIYEFASRYLQPLLRVLELVDTYHRIGRNIMIVGIKN